MNFLDVILIGLASWRMASLLVGEDGPGLIFDKLRTRVGANNPGKIEGFLPSVFSCIYCMSVWTTLFAAFLFWVIDPVVVMILAAMSVALIVNKFAGLDD